MIARLMISAIRFYQRADQPGQYAACVPLYSPPARSTLCTAIERFGAWKGGWLALWRILRCNPFLQRRLRPRPRHALDTTLRRE